MRSALCALLKTMKYSAIIMLEEQHEDFAEFVQNLHDLLSSKNEPFEIVIVANGTGGFLRNQMDHLRGCHGNLKAFELNTHVPQSVCLKAGFKESSGEIILACGSYQQITNDSFGRLLDSLDSATDIINPWRKSRVDSRFKQLRSAIYNATVRKIIKSDLHDLNCTVKVFRRKVLDEVQLYGNMYRYMPIIAAQKGYKTKEVECEHYQQRGGKSGISNLPEYLTRVIDIMTLYFNTRFTKKPLRFFSTIGLGFLVTGLLITAYVFIEKIFLGSPMGGRPILLLALLLMVLGLQAASAGLLGEIVVFTRGRHEKEYTIEKTI